MFDGKPGVEEAVIGLEVEEIQRSPKTVGEPAPLVIFNRQLGVAIKFQTREAGQQVADVHGLYR